MCQKIKRIALPATMLFGLVLAVACAPMTTQPSSAAANTEQASSTTGLETATPDEIPPSTVFEPGKVTIALSALSYAEGQMIEATLANGLEQTIYTEDSKSDCSIVSLEQWNGQVWQPLLGCALGRAPLVVAIGPGLGRRVTINPLSTHLGVSPGSTEPAFGAGMYRVKFTYRLDPGPEGEAPYEVYSEAFDIRP